MTIFERVQKVYYDVANGNKSMFGNMIGVNPSTIQSQFSRSSVSVDVLEHMLKAFGDLSADWLMKEEGDMWKPKPQVVVDKHIEGDNSSVDCNNTDVLMHLVTTLSQQLQEKDAQIASLIEKIK